MKRVEILTPVQASDLIHDGVTIIAATVGYTGHAESVLKNIEKRFLETGHPRDLTFMHPAGSQGPNKTGSVHLCHEGLVKRYIAAHWGNSPEWCELVESNKVECYSFSQGTISQMYRSNGSGQPGHLTKIGLDTFIDPRIEGGKMNPRTKENGPDLVEVKEIDGEEYLFYKPIPVDFALIRGTYADEYGNITMDDEAIRLETLAAVLAAKHWGGKVVCQVKKIFKGGSFRPNEVVIPGCYVDYLVECDDVYSEHRMTAGTYFDPVLLGKYKYSDDKIPGIPVEMNIRKIIGRRAALEIKKHDMCNVGVGIPYDTISRTLYEEGVRKDVLFTVETGVFGGTLPNSFDFGAAYNFDAMWDQLTMFDFYSGCGLDLTFMGVGEIDPMGNGNASKMNGKAVGCGGFVDITQNARKVVFCTTFTAKGLKIDWDEEKGITILKEGSVKKFVNQIIQKTFSSDFARKAGQEIMWVTERAVFVMTDTGIKLTEIARGIDLQKDILDQMEFVPEIADDLKEINPIIYRNGLIDMKSLLGCEE